MTGVLNRDGFRDQAVRRLARASRAGQALGLLLIDMDHFKTINDRGGHAAGDAALQLLAQMAQGQLRSADLLGRYGGDEFAALLEEDSPQQIQAAGHRLCSAFAAAAANSVPGLQPTLSIGMALSEPGMSLDALLGRADAALYQAKAEGRNRVVAAGRPPRASHSPGSAKVVPIRG